MPNYNYAPQYPAANPYGPYNPYQAYQPPTIGQQNPPVMGAQMPQASQPMQQPAPQIQSGGFMSVRSIDEAYNWPLAPGVSMTFKVENAPIVCTKTRGFSPLEEPVFKIFDMHERIQQPIESPAAAPQAPEAPTPAYALQSDVEAISGAVEVMKNELQDFRARMDELTAKKPGTRKKEDSDHAE